MNINIIETNIINRLKTTITELKVEGFPDNPQEYRLLHPKGAILVHFQGADFHPPETVMQQLVNVNFNITLLVKGLRDKNGAYDYIERVLSSLTGFKAQGNSRLYPLKTEFISEDGGIWQYNIAFTLSGESYCV